MKILIEDNLVSFKPKTIKIVCETQDELDALATIFQTAKIDDAVKKVWPSLKDESGSALPSFPTCGANPKCGALVTAMD